MTHMYVYLEAAFLFEQLALLSRSKVICTFCIINKYLFVMQKLKGIARPILLLGSAELTSFLKSLHLDHGM